MKTRIRVVEKNNGKKYYEVQYKKFNNTPAWVIMVSVISIVLIPTLIMNLIEWFDDQYFFTEEEAKSRIDELQADNQTTLGKRTKKVSYIKYP